MGPNEIPSRAGRNLAQIMLETMREPMFLLLVGAALLHLLLGDLHMAAAAIRDQSRSLNIKCARST